MKSKDLNLYNHKCYNCRKLCNNYYCSEKCKTAYRKKNSKIIATKYPHLNIIHNVQELQQMILSKVKQNKVKQNSTKYKNIPTDQFNVIEEIFL